MPHLAADVIGLQRLHVDRFVGDPPVDDLRPDERRTPVEQHENLVGIVVHIQFHDTLQRLFRRIVQEGYLPFVSDQERSVTRSGVIIRIDYLHGFHHLFFTC